MKFYLFATTAIILSTVSLAPSAQAENLEDVHRLLTTRECQSCELGGASLVYTDLSGTHLANANLRRANLNRANLTNADLRRANLAGATLFNADLRGADLRGADLRGADLRETYMSDVNLEGALLDGANLRGAIGVPAQAVTAEDFHQWGLIESDRGNFEGAIHYFSQSIALRPNFAPAYLGRGMSRYNSGDVSGALDDVRRAETIYSAQDNEVGQQTTANIIQGITESQEAAERRRSGGGGSNFLNFLGSMGMLLLRLML